MDSRVSGNDGQGYKSNSTSSGRYVIAVARGLVPRSLPEDAGYKPALPGRFVSFLCEK